MIDNTRLNSLMDISFRIRWLVVSYAKSKCTLNSDHEFKEEARKLAHEIENWCNVVDA